MYLGIDLGTSNSVIAGIVDGAVRVFKPVDGGDVLPSVIFFDKRGHRLYGRRAYDQAMLQPDAVAMGFKRLLGTSTPIQIPAVGLSLSAEECTAEILRQLIGQAVTETGGQPIHGTVITVPAAFNQMQREATMRAAKTAGLEHVTLLQEPIAAAMSALGTQRRSGQYLIYDLGGGTFDLALVEAIEGQVNIVAHQGINMLGGRDFDRMLVNEVVRPWLAATFDLPEYFQRDKQYHRLIRIAHIAAEKAKIDLSTLEETTIFASDEEVRLTDQSGAEIFLEAPVTRKQYETLLRESIMQTVELTRQILEENNYRQDEIDKIIFIGGPSRTPLIREIVAHELGIPTDLKVDPLTSVAIGAAHYATIYEWGQRTPQPAPQNLRPATPPDLRIDDEPNGAPKTQSGAVTVPMPDAKPAQKDTPKPEQKPAGPPPPLTLDYQTPVSETDTMVHIRRTGDAGDTTAIQIEADNGWASDIFDLEDAMEIKVPVKNLGANDYHVRYFDARDRLLDQYRHSFSVTRSETARPKIPATQAIAVKALDHLQGQTNILVPIIGKGELLPARGKAEFKSAREIAAGSRDYVSFELFQAEYPERVELNLCVGVFRIAGNDLPPRYVLRPGDTVIFNWRMTDGGILQATVSLPQASGRAPVELQTPRFYSPQAGEMNFDAEHGGKFAAALLRQAEEERGDLVAAAGPAAGKDFDVLRQRILSQQDVMAESQQDPEIIRKISEEARKIRQDIARLGKTHRGAVLQRQLGKLTAIFNRLAREHAEKPETERFENHVGKVQAIIDAAKPEGFNDADRHFVEMRDIFFAAAWRDDQYVQLWLDRLRDESYLFPDAAEFARLIKEADAAKAAKDMQALRKSVSTLLEARLALAANDTAGELATIVKA